MDPAFAAIVGAVVGAAAVVAAQFLTARASWKIERGQRLADRWTALLAAGHHASLSIGQVARAPMDRKEEVIREYVWPEVDRLNSALEAVLLHDGPRFADAAKGFDKVLIELDGKFGPYPAKPCRWVAGLAQTATMNWQQLQAHLNQHYPKRQAPD